MIRNNMRQCNTTGWCIYTLLSYVNLHAQQLFACVVSTLVQGDEIYGT